MPLSSLAFGLYELMLSTSKEGLWLVIWCLEATSWYNGDEVYGEVMTLSADRMYDPDSPGNTTVSS